MKCFIIGLACLAFTAMSCVDATAGWLSSNRAGGVTGGFNAHTPNLGDLTVPLSVTNFHYDSAPASRSGAFAGIMEIGDLVWGGTYNFDSLGSTIGDAYFLNSSTFGSFTGTVTSDTGFNQVGPGAGNRTLNLVGLFTPGSNAHYEGDSTSLSGAFLQIALSRGDGGSISASWNLDTTASSPVPEPASLAIFGLGGGVMAFVRRRRSKSKAIATV